MLTALGRIVVEAIFASYTARAKRSGLEDTQCGAINFVQRHGSSVNLHVHFHVVVLDGVVARDPEAGVVFHPAAPPTRDELDEIVRRVQKRAEAWLRRHGYLDDRPLEDRSNEPPVQTAIDACASIAMGRGRTEMLANDGEPENDDPSLPGKSLVVADRDGFNLHAGVRIEAGDDANREKLVRYAARPPLSLARLRRLPGGRVAYRLKHVGRGRGKHRVMDPMEFMARLAAIIPPPRYPLVRYAGVLGPRSSWRKDVVPKPRERRPTCNAAAGRPHGADPVTQPAESKTHDACPERPNPVDRSSAPMNGDACPQRREPDWTPPAQDDSATRSGQPGAAGTLRVRRTAAARWRCSPPSSSRSPRTSCPCVTGTAYSVACSTPPPRASDWASLLRRSMDVDVLQCPKCHGRLRVLAVITEREPVQRILSHLGLPTEPPPLARARDPSDELDDEPGGQLELGLA